MQQVVDFVLSNVVTILLAITFSYIIFPNKIRKNKKRLLILTLICFTIGLFIYSIPNLFLKTILSFFLHIFFFQQFLYIKIGKSIFISFIFFIITMLSDLFQLFFITKVMGLSKIEIYDIFAGSFISNTIFFLIFLIFILLIKQMLLKLFESDINNKRFYLLLILSIIIFGCLFANIILEYKNDKNIITFVLTILFFIILIFSLIRDKVLIWHKMVEYNGLLEFMNDYETQLENIKTVNHEIKNQFLTIISMLKDLVPQNDIIKYINNLVADYKNIDDINYVDLKYLPSNGIKGFTCTKIKKAEDLFINIDIVVSKEIKNSILGELFENDFKILGIIMGVFLDNAIEASSISKDKKLGIEFIDDFEYVIIIISNTFINKIKTDDLSDNFVSTKGTDRGRGLKLVNKVIKRTKQISIQSEIIDNMFVQKIYVSKNVNLVA